MENFNFKKLFDSFEIQGNYLIITEDIITEKMLSDKGIRFNKTDIKATGSPDVKFVLECSKEEIGLIELTKKITTEDSKVDIKPYNQNMLVKSISEPFNSMLIDNIKSLRQVSFKYTIVEAIDPNSRFHESIVGKKIIIPNGAINDDGNTVHNQDNPYSILNIINYLSSNTINSYFKRVYTTIVPYLITTEYFLIPEHEVKGSIG